MVFFGTLRDPEGRMLEVAKQRLPKISKFFDGMHVAVAPDTDKRMFEILEANGINVYMGGGYGDGKRTALNQAMEGSSETLVGIDFDKLLYWYQIEPNELADLAKLNVKGLTIMGRTDKAWKTYPESWKMTERVINYLANKKFGRTEWDWFTGTCIVNNELAKKLYESSEENGVGIIFEWVRMTLKEGYVLEYVEFEGLSFEDPDRFQNEIKEMGYEKWLEAYYDNENEWKRRLDNLKVSAEAIWTMSQ